MSWFQAKNIPFGYLAGGDYVPHTSDRALPQKSKPGRAATWPPFPVYSARSDDLVAQALRLGSRGSCRSRSSSSSSRNRASATGRGASVSTVSATDTAGQRVGHVALSVEDGVHKVRLALAYATNATLATLAAVTRVEIGRASCRERV